MGRVTWAYDVREDGRTRVGPSKPGAAVPRMSDPRVTSPQFRGRGGGAGDGRAGEVLRTRHTASERRNHVPDRAPATPCPRAARAHGKERAGRRPAKCTMRRDPRAGGRGAGRTSPPAGSRRAIGEPMEHCGARMPRRASRSRAGKSRPRPRGRLRPPRVVASPHHVSNVGLKIASLRAATVGAGIPSKPRCRRRAAQPRWPRPPWRHASRPRHRTPARRRTP